MRALDQAKAAGREAVYGSEEDQALEHGGHLRALDTAVEAGVKRFLDAVIEDANARITFLPGLDALRALRVEVEGDQ